MEVLPPPLDALLEAWNAWDVERAVGLLHPDVEIRGVRAALENTSYRGRDSARRFFSDLEESWSSTHAEALAFEAFGDRVAVTLRLCMQARTTEMEFERTIGILYEIDDGLVLSWLTYLNPAQAYETAAAGYPSRP